MMEKVSIDLNQDGKINRKDVVKMQKKIESIKNNPKELNNFIGKLNKGIDDLSIEDKKQLQKAILNVLNNGEKLSKQEEQAILTGNYQVKKSLVILNLKLKGVIASHENPVSKNISKENTNIEEKEKIESLDKLADYFQIDKKELETLANKLNDLGLKVDKFLSDYKNIIETKLLGLKDKYPNGERFLNKLKIYIGKSLLGVGDNLKKVEERYNEGVEDGDIKGLKLKDFKWDINEALIEKFDFINNEVIPSLQVLLKSKEKGFHISLRDESLYNIEERLKNIEKMFIRGNYEEYKGEIFDMSQTTATFTKHGIDKNYLKEKNIKIAKIPEFLSEEDKQIEAKVLMAILKELPILLIPYYGDVEGMKSDSRDLFGVLDGITEKLKAEGKIPKEYNKLNSSLDTVLGGVGIIASIIALIPLVGTASEFVGKLLRMGKFSKIFKRLEKLGISKSKVIEEMKKIGGKFNTSKNIIPEEKEIEEGLNISIKTEKLPENKINELIEKFMELDSGLNKGKIKDFIKHGLLNDDFYESLVKYKGSEYLIKEYEKKINLLKEINFDDDLKKKIIYLQENGVYIKIDDLKDLTEKDYTLSIKSKNAIKILKKNGIFIEYKDLEKITLDNFKITKQDLKNLEKLQNNGYDYLDITFIGQSEEIINNLIKLHKAGLTIFSHHLSELKELKLQDIDNFVKLKEEGILDGVWNFKYFTGFDKKDIKKIIKLAENLGKERLLYHFHYSLNFVKEFNDKQIDILIKITSNKDHISVDYIDLIKKLAKENLLNKFEKVYDSGLKISLYDIDKTIDLLRKINLSNKDFSKLKKLNELGINDYLTLFLYFGVDILNNLSKVDDNLINTIENIKKVNPEFKISLTDLLRNIDFYKKNISKIENFYTYINEKLDNIKSIKNILKEYKGLLEEQEKEAIYLLQKIKDKNIKIDKEILDFFTSDSFENPHIFKLVFEIFGKQKELINNDIIIDFIEKGYSNQILKLYEENPDSFENISEDLIYIIQVFVNSPSSDLQKVAGNFIPQILKSENPKKLIDELNDIFVKNNLPLVGKIYKVLKSFYPEGEYSRFLLKRGEKNTSPYLVGIKDNYERSIFTLYRDSLKMSILSGDENLKEYFIFLKEGSKVLGKFESNQNLTEFEKIKLKNFFEKIARLSSELQLDIDTNKELGEIYDNIKAKLKVTNSSELIDKLSSQFLKPVGISSIDEALEIMDKSIKEVNERNMKLVEGKTYLYLEKGDIVHGSNSEYLRLILESGFKSGDVLGVDKVDDLVSFSHNLEEIQQDIKSNIMDNLGVSKNYGNIKFVTKDRGQFFRTNTKNKNGEIINLGNYKELFKKENRWKYERYYGGPHKNQLLIRTGLPINEIDFAIVNTKAMSKKDLQNIYFELARKGIYIPIVDNDGKIIFTPEKFNKYREIFYGVKKGIKVDIVGLEKNSKFYEEIKKCIPTEKEFEFTKSISNGIKKDTYKLLKEKFGIESFDSINKYDLSKAKMDDTGSTGRLTNLADNFDFDFSLQISAKDIKKIDEIKEEILKFYKPEKQDIYSQGDGLQIRMFGVNYNGEKIDIDIFINKRPERPNMEVHDAISKKLDFIKQEFGEEGYEEVIVNIRYAKQFFKDLGIYKKGITGQGGFGGIGIETWILNNNGSFEKALNSLKKALKENNTYNEFRDNYLILGAGDNIKKGGMENFTYNMTEKSFDALKKKLL